LAGILTVSLAACDEDSGILDPNANPEATALDLQFDPDLIDALILDAEAAIDGSLGPAAVAGLETGASATLFAAPPDPADVEAARELLRQAREKFEAAREAWRNGDSETAAQLAYEARLLVAEALITVFGEEAYERLWQRLEQAISWLEEQVDQETSELIERIKELMGEAEDIKNEDPPRDDTLIRATERLVLAAQIANREWIHMRRQELAQHARLQVFMAMSAGQLSATIAEEGELPTEVQVRILQHGQHLLRHAVDALETGRFRLAFGLAREAENVFLAVVMNEPGIEQARVEAMVSLAQVAIAAAEQALQGQDPQSFPAKLLEHAKKLQQRGNAVAFSQPRVAIHVLWHAAAIAYGVIQLVDTA
jgi:HEPN domain-containing protein